MITMPYNFSQVTSNPARQDTSETVSQRETKVRGKLEQKSLGRDAYDTLMALLAEEQESPTTNLGTFVANSTKRNLKKQIESLFRP